MTRNRPLATASAAAATTAATTAHTAARAAPMDESIEEGAIPRWRRPSLRAARSASDRGPAGPTYQLAFNAAAIEGSERRLVRYRVVRMMDGPDEIRSQEVGQLEENDQVEVLGRYAGYLHVRTPVGTEGWVHRTTLGPPIGSEDPDAPVGPPEFDLEAAFDMQRARTSAPPAPAPSPVAAPPAPAPARTKAPKKGSEKTSRRRSPKAEPST